MKLYNDNETRELLNELRAMEPAAAKNFVETDCGIDSLVNFEREMAAGYRKFEKNGCCCGAGENWENCNCEDNFREEIFAAAEKLLAAEMGW